MVDKLANAKETGHRNVVRKDTGKKLNQTGACKEQRCQSDCRAMTGGRKSS